MERIKTNYALSLNEKIALFGRPYYAGEPRTYFLGWRADYVGPRDPRYKTEGAHYDGAIIAEIPSASPIVSPAYETIKITPIGKNILPWPISWRPPRFSELSTLWPILAPSSQTSPQQIFIAPKMKTKSLAQIEAQRVRLLHLNGAYVGRDNTPAQLARAYKIDEITTRYYLNIKHWARATTMAMQRGEWDNVQVPQAVYMNK